MNYCIDGIKDYVKLYRGDFLELTDTELISFEITCSLHQKIENLKLNCKRNAVSFNNNFFINNTKYLPIERKYKINKLCLI